MEADVDEASFVARAAKFHALGCEVVDLEDLLVGGAGDESAGLIVGYSEVRSRRIEYQLRLGKIIANDLLNLVLLAA